MAVSHRIFPVCHWNRMGDKLCVRELLFVCDRGDDKYFDEHRLLLVFR